MDNPAKNDSIDSTPPLSHTGKLSNFSEFNSQDSEDVHTDRSRFSRREETRHLSNLSNQFEIYLQSIITELISVFHSRMSRFVTLMTTFENNHDSPAIQQQRAKSDPTPHIRPRINRTANVNVEALNSSFHLLHGMLVKLADIIKSFEDQQQRISENFRNNDKEYDNLYVQYMFQISYYLVEFMGDFLSRLSNLINFSTYFSPGSSSRSSSPVFFPIPFMSSLNNYSNPETLHYNEDNLPAVRSRSSGKNRRSSTVPDDAVSNEKEIKPSEDSGCADLIYNPGPMRNSGCRGFVLMPSENEKRRPCYGSGCKNSEGNHMMLSFDVTQFTLCVKESIQAFASQQDRENSEMDLLHILMYCGQNAMQWNSNYCPSSTNKCPHNTDKRTKTTNNEECNCENANCSNIFPGTVGVKFLPFGRNMVEKHAQQETELEKLDDIKMKKCRCNETPCCCPTDSSCASTKDGKINNGFNDHLDEERVSMQSNPKDKLSSLSQQCNSCLKYLNIENELFNKRSLRDQMPKNDVTKTAGNEDQIQSGLFEKILHSSETGHCCLDTESGMFSTGISDASTQPTARELIPENYDSDNVPHLGIQNNQYLDATMKATCHCPTHTAKESKPPKSYLNKTSEPENNLSQLITEYLTQALGNMGAYLHYQSSPFDTNTVNNICASVSEVLSNFAKTVNITNSDTRKYDKACQTNESYYPGVQSPSVEPLVKFDTPSSSRDSLIKVCRSCADDIGYYFSPAQPSHFSNDVMIDDMCPEKFYVARSNMLHPNHDTLPGNVLEVREIINGRLRVYTEDYFEDIEKLNGQYQCRYRGRPDVDVIKRDKKNMDCSMRVIYTVGGLLPKQVSSKTNIGTAEKTRGLNLPQYTQENSSNSTRGSTLSWPGNYPFTAKDAKEIEIIHSPIPDSHFHNKMWIFFDDMHKAKYKAGPPLVLKLRHGRLLEEAFETLMCPSRIPLNYYRDIWVYFKVKNELLTDEDKSQDLFTLLSRHLFSPCHFQLFDHPTDDSSALYLNPATPAKPRIFQFAGVIFALALMHQKQLGVKLPIAFFKCLLDRPFTVNDLDEIDPPLYQKLKWLQRNRLSKSNVQMNFTVKDKYGEHTYYRELVPDGNTVLVTDANKARFIELVVKWKLAQRCFQQLKEFRRGVVTVLEPCLLAVFTAEELQYLIAKSPGNGQLDKAQSIASRRDTW